MKYRGKKYQKGGLKGDLYNSYPHVTPEQVALDKAWQAYSSAQGSIPLNNGFVTYPGDSLAANQIPHAISQMVVNKQLTPTLLGYKVNQFNSILNAGENKKYKLSKKDIDKINNQLNPIMYLKGDDSDVYLPAPKYQKGGVASLAVSLAALDPTKPQVYKTQAELDAANAFAKSFTARRFANNNGVLNPQDVYVAKKVGDPVVPFIDGKTGLPFVDNSPSVKKQYNVPWYVNLSDIQGDGSNYWYEDRNGHNIDVDASVLNLPRFKKRLGGSLSKYQSGGPFDPITGEPIVQLKPNTETNYDFIQPNQNIIRPKVDGEDLFKIDQEEQSKGTPNDFQVVVPKQKSPYNPYFAMRAATVGLAELSGRAERKRQDQYFYNQQSTLGQRDALPYQDFQPNPYSMYAKYGGSLKKYGGNVKYRGK
jgi:hypothetical protein